jgi:predicted permease
MWLDSLLQDLRFGVRMLRKHPLLSLAVIVTFSLGIGLASAAFNITNGFVHKPLPFEESGRIQVLRLTAPERNIDDMGFSTHDLVDWREQQSVFEQLAGYTTTRVNLSHDIGAPDGQAARQPQRYYGALFSAGVFEALRVQPILGRTFRPEEERPDADPVIVIGYDIWQSQFGGAADVLGKTVLADGVRRTIVGVMPGDFRFPNFERVWLPLVIDLSANERGDGLRFSVMGRLRDGVSASEAEAQAATIAADLAQAYPLSNEGVRPTMRTLKRALIPGAYYGLFYTMVAAALGVLLIGCVNVANLLLARATTRTQEIAVRSALGAARRRLILQLLAEISILALVGGVIGFVLGNAGLGWFRSQMDYVLANAGGGEELPFWIHFDSDIRVVLFVIGATALAGVLAGLYPALRVSATNVAEVMKGSGRGASGLRIRRLSGALIVAEVAVSCVLLVLAGLFIVSITQLNAVDLNYSTENVYTARVNLPEAGYADAARRREFQNRLLVELLAIPGVEAAALSDSLPPIRIGAWPIEVDGEIYLSDADYPLVRRGAITPDYFQTFGTRILRGRPLRPSDRGDTAPVAVVNATLARTYFPEGDAVGRRFRVRGDTAAGPWVTVVGIVADMKAFPMGGDGVPEEYQNPACFYLPMAQVEPGSFVTMALRTQGAPTARAGDVRAAVAAIDPNLPLFMELSLEGVILRMVWFYPVFSSMFTAFGLGALFLAAVGLYGVMSFVVTQRTREIGVRMALGARSGQLVALVLRRGIIQIGLGLGIGLTLALLSSAPLSILLFEVRGRDPRVFVLVVLTLVLTGLLASLFPARRVTRVDPAAALGSE